MYYKLSCLSLFFGRLRAEWSWSQITTRKNTSTPNIIPTMHTTCIQQMCITEAFREGPLMPITDPLWTRSASLCMDTNSPNSWELWLVSASCRVMCSLLHAFKDDTMLYCLIFTTSQLWSDSAAWNSPSLSFLLSLLLQLHYLLPSQSYSYQLDKEPEGESCQMSVFDRWDFCGRLVYTSLISYTSSFSLSVYHIQTALRTNLMCLFEVSWRRTNCCCYLHQVFARLCERACIQVCIL